MEVGRGTPWGAASRPLRIVCSQGRGAFRRPARAGPDSDRQVLAHTDMGACCDSHWYYRCCPHSAIILFGGEGYSVNLY